MAEISKPKNQTNGNGVLDRMGKWYNALILVILIGTGIGNYMINNYRVQHLESEIVKMDRRLDKVEGVNYELLAQQLKDIERANAEINGKIEKTNERIDKVLEILLGK